MRRRYAAGMVGVVAVAQLAVVGGGVMYTQAVQEESARRHAAQQAESDRRWCDIFQALYLPDAPPVTERGRVSQDLWRKKLVQFGCEVPR